jgi:hypothetical protein
MKLPNNDAKVSVKAGDVIVAFAGKAVSNPQELQAVVEQSQIGKEQAVTVLRDGNPSVLSQGDRLSRHFPLRGAAGGRPTQQSPPRAPRLSDSR